MRKRELKRQLFHICGGLLIVGSLYFDLLGITGLVILCFLALISSFLSLVIKIPGITYLLNEMEREHNMKDWPGRGVFFYLLGCTLAVAIFDKNIAMAGILIMALGDSFSHYIGRFHGKIKHPFTDRREVEGWTAGIIMATLGAWLFVPLYAALIASIIAMTFEMIDMKILGQKIDDNFTLPLVAGAVLYIILML